MSRSMIAFDLDGTVTTEELLPRIASELDLLEEMRLLTKLTLDGTIRFDQSFRLRFQILRNIPVSRVRQIVTSIPLDPDIGTFIRKNTDRCVVITGNLDLWVAPLLNQLGCRWYASRGTEAQDRAVSLDHVLLKSEAVTQVREDGRRIVAVGESLNDIPMFEQADVCIAYGGVHEPTKLAIETADYVVYEGGALCRLLNTL